MTGRLRPRALGWRTLAVVSVSLLAGTAEAAPQRRDSGPLFTQIDTGQGAAATARALAAKGDCAKALASFDVALRSSIDMTIRRDRGLCHEQLGNPFPAMDDYRAYLTVSPEAPDAADIRLRLERLETLTGVGGPSAIAPTSTSTTTRSAEDVPDEPARIGDSTIETTDTGRRSNQRRTSYDAEESAYRKYDQAMTSPLRRGTGGIFGLYSDGRAISFDTGGGGVGGGYVNGFEVGASIRWSFSQVSTVYAQVGYAGLQLGGVASSSTIGGVALGIGYEVRIRLDQYATNQLVFGPAFEFQYVVAGSTGAVGGAFSGGGQGVNVLLPEGRIGYRHIFGYGFGLEFLFNVGETIFAEPGLIQASREPVLGGTLGLVVAF